jgi:hypothetical protein
MSALIEKFRETFKTYPDKVLLNDLQGVFDYNDIRDLAVMEFNFEVYEIHDSWNLRINYESNFKISPNKLIVILKKNFNALTDIKLNFSEITLDLRKFFPQFEIKPIIGFSFNQLEQLFNLSQSVNKKLGQRETTSFILNNLFQIEENDFESKQSIISAFLQINLTYSNFNIYFVDFLSALFNKHFGDRKINPFNKIEFGSFIRKEFIKFINQENNDINFSNSKISNKLKLNFISNRVEPIKVSKELFDNCDIKEGIFFDEIEFAQREHDSLKQYICELIKGIQRIEDWLSIIQTIGKYKHDELYYKLESDLQFENSINKIFQKSIKESYSYLLGKSSYQRPYIVSQINDYISFKKYQKVCVIVLDGLNFWQWLTIKDKIVVSFKDYWETALFSMIPSITNYSRYAIFSGSIPNIYGNSRDEEKSWTNYWETRGVNKNLISYQRISITNSVIPDFNSNYSRVGIVCTDTDDILHSCTLGNEELFNTSTTWALKASKIRELIQSYLSQNYKVFITADHGNGEFQGIKSDISKFSFGTISRSKRFIDFQNETILNSFLSNSPEFEFQIQGNSIYLMDNKALAKEKSTVTHGGSHFWEVLVPFIEIKE